MNITDFALWMHLLVSLLRTCYQESEQTKANDMEGSCHWDCTVFACIHRKHIPPLFSPPFELALYLCPPDILRMAILSPNQGIPWKPWLSVLVSPASTVLGALLLALRCSVSRWRLRANWNPSKAWESALYTHTVWGLPGIWALSGWVHVPTETLPRPWPGHQFSFLLFLFPKWTNLCQRRRATFPSIVSMREVVSDPIDRDADISPLLFWMARLQQVIFSESQT